MSREAVELSGGRAARLLCGLLAAGSCPACGRKRTPAGAAAGTIRELTADDSVTTDVNARAPAFARADFSGALIRTQDAIGSKVLLLDFWSVFCQSCLREMPFLKDLQRRYGPEGLQIVGVNTDFFPKERINGFLDKTGLALPYPLIHDRDQSLSKLFSVEALPVLVLIDSAGWIRMVHLGYRPEDEREIERRVSQACGRIKDTVVTLQPVGGTTAFSPPEKGRSLAAPGTPVGGFTAIGADGGEFSFAAWRDDAPALVFFWSIFCQPCREEFSAWLAGCAPPLPGLAAVNTIRSCAGRRRDAAAWEELTGVFDRESEGGRFEVAGLFGVAATPSTFLVGSDGTVRATWSGEVDEATLTAGILAHAGTAAGAAKEAAP
jgi:thiol-disulfide isomerase/thioredoxin